MTGKLGWGIISTGRIAGVFAEGVAASNTGRLVAVASRTQEAAHEFGVKFGIERRYGGYDAILDDSEVEAVYVATPHPVHAEWAVKCAEAGKHILCEKPLAVDYAEAMAVVEAALRNDVFLMEAFMYRCHPQTEKLVELVRDGAIGDVRMIQATFSFRAGPDPESRLMNNALGGGGILDVGCYCTSMSRLIAGVAVGKPFAEPIEVRAIGHVGETRVDEYTAAVLRFPNDIIAQVSTGVRLNQENVVRIYGTGGSILVPSPWMCSRQPGTSKIIVERPGQDPEEILIATDKGLYTIEADTVAANIENRQAPSPAMTWDDTLGNMRTLDSWRHAIGLTYDAELDDAQFPTIDHEPLVVRPGSNMKYGRVEGLDKDVSRLIMGSVLASVHFALPHVSVLFDEFFARGGNCFDTAYIYGGGLSERALGQWIANRGIREQVVILDKGAHTPNCYPEAMSTQLMESLERMQTDYVDIYLLHRDNPEVEVGEFVDVLNEHHAAGRIRAFGGSNWSLERVDAANEYAKSKGLVGFTAVSNNFSLARMVEPVWDGCIAASDPASIAWFEETRIPLLAWSSLGRGFFVSGDPNDESDQVLVKSWYSEDNFRRLERAKELAAKRGVEPVMIAMAYALNQPFPVFPLFGPATLEELRISLSALDTELTPEEVAWLNLQS